jgi:hypothetical protein
MADDETKDPPQPEGKLPDEPIPSGNDTSGAEKPGVEPLAVHQLTAPEVVNLTEDIRGALIEAAPEGLVDSNFALAVFIEGMMLLSMFGVQRAWMHEVVDVYGQRMDEGTVPSAPPVKASKVIH